MRASSFCIGCTLALGVFLTAAVNAAQGTSTTADPQAGARQASPASQGSVAQPASGTQAPMGGRGFGEHVSQMAPEHPKDHGVMFGECVSEMAIGDDCEHLVP